MDLYETTSYELSKHLTERYSTSFSLSSTLFSSEIRHHIYALYGMVRIADEIVDTFSGETARQQLDAFAAEVLGQSQAPQPFSPNPLIHAFALTAKRFSITQELITPFFDSMRTDLTAQTFTRDAYERYIYGSAEVIGLYCLKVFVDGDQARYQALETGARALGAAYQKINFLRDFSADYTERGRIYFPGLSSPSDLTDAAKQAIIADIQSDLARVPEAIAGLPAGGRKAVLLSYRYYSALLEQLDHASAHDILSQRLRVSTPKKLALYARTRWLS